MRHKSQPAWVYGPSAASTFSSMNTTLHEVLIMQKNVMLNIGIGIAAISLCLGGCKAIGTGAVVAGERAAMGAGAKTLVKELGTKAIEGVAAGVSDAVATSSIERIMGKEKSEHAANASMTIPLGRRLSDYDSLISAKAPTTSLPEAKLDEKIIAELKMAIRCADDAESFARTNMDASRLGEYFSGEALKEESARIDRARSSGDRRATSCVKIDFNTFKVSNDGLRAEVHVVERWRSQLLDANGLASGDPSESDYPQTVFLDKSGGEWKVAAFIMD